MANVIRTQAIILRRTDYGEADRILQLLTPDHGKLSLIAKGVRKEKSKLAGGIELFAVSDVGFITGKSDIGTLTGARLDKYFSHIVEDYDRTQLAYEAIKQISRAAESVTEAAFFELLRQLFAALDDHDVPLQLVETWFWLQLNILLGLGLNLTTDSSGMKLVEDSNYEFDEADMTFIYRPEGRFTTDHIKLLRLLSARPPQVAAQVRGVDQLTPEVAWLARNLSPK